MEVISLIIAIMALLFSGITYFAHDRRLKKQEEQINAYHLQKQEEEKTELKKAVVRGNVVKGEKGRRIIKVFNAGKAVARNIDIKLLGDGEFIGGNNPFPYEFLNPQEGTEMTLFMHMGSPDKLLIELSWIDDFQTNNIHQQMLTL
jgi:archaellum component FlaF (FlaF/FlaG flagellin family)